MRPASTLPSTLSSPSICAGDTVSAASICSAPRPASRADRMREGKSPRSASRAVVSATGTPAAISFDGFDGASAHVARSRVDTESATLGELRSGVRGKFTGRITGSRVATISSSLRNSMPDPKMAARRPNSEPMAAARSASSSVDASKITISRPRATPASASSAGDAAGGSLPAGLAVQTSTQSARHRASCIA